MKPTAFCLLFALLFIQCTSNTDFDHITDQEVKSVLEKGIAASGGLDNWKNGKAYTFNKRTILYLEDDTVESKSEQIVTIKNHPQLEGTIHWNNRTDTTDIKIVYADGQATKYIDNQAQSAADNEAAELSFLGAHLVMNLPFKLLDPGIALTYDGQQTMFDRKVEVLIADYNKEQANHNKTHRWWHYFDATTYEYVGYKVFHPPTYALVENRKSTVHNGITYTTDRVTWRVDSLNNKQFIRAKFAYDRFGDVD